MHTGVFNPIDLSRDGKFIDTVNLPYSVDRSPYYQIRLPVCRVQNGEGPSILLIGGNHGDEYEGPMALNRLARALDPEGIRGAVTILPALNTPAVAAHARCSPFDGGNLNRSFPGDAAGSPTQRIAAFVTRSLIPFHDVMFDLHSGGTSMDHMACGIMEVSGDAAREARCRDLLAAMGLAHAFIADNGAAPPTSLGAANQAGKLAISGEFGGGASTSPETMAATCTALDGVLVSLEILSEPLLGSVLAPDHTTEFLGLDHQDLFVYAREDGWFEPAAAIGDWVEEGHVAGWMHDLMQPGEATRELRFKAAGLVIAKRLHSHVERGDCLFALGRKL